MAETKENPTYKLELASSPHVHSRWSTVQAMWLVVIALIPSVITAVLFFGYYQLVIILVSIGFAVGTEVTIKTIRKRKVSIKDGSALITGLLLGLILPPNFSLTSTALGAIISIAVGKEVFGGIGYNIFNPALVGRAFLQAAFPVPMTTWAQPNFAVDGISTATPLSAIKFDSVFADTQSLFMGNVAGSIGETSAIAVLLGGVFLIAIGIVNWRVPVSTVLGILVFGGIFWLFDASSYPTPIFHLFAGGFLFGAFFMATDWVTSPLTARGMWIYGLGISLVLILIRLFGGLPEGVMYSILLMNAFVPLINKFTQPKTFGKTI
jgi:H+/Na+-translocating ferredoxin:NAD+ oxidoreductase subunit D